MSLLDARDNEERSYLDLVDALSRYGAAPTEDIRALWRRMVFNILISNTDDHLRNHGFLYESPSGWRLSPAYDLNPVPMDVRPRILSLSIDETEATASLELAMKVASYFRLEEREAAPIAAEVGRSVSNWRNEAKAIGLSSGAIERMESAFEHEDLKLALTPSSVSSRRKR